MPLYVKLVLVIRNATECREGMEVDADTFKLVGAYKGAEAF